MTHENLTKDEYIALGTWISEKSAWRRFSEFLQLEQEVEHMRKQLTLERRIHAGKLSSREVRAIVVFDEDDTGYCSWLEGDAHGRTRDVLEALRSLCDAVERGRPEKEDG